MLDLFDPLFTRPVCLIFILSKQKVQSKVNSLSYCGRRFVGYCWHWMNRLYKPQQSLCLLSFILLGFNLDSGGKKSILIGIDFSNFPSHNRPACCFIMTFSSLIITSILFKCHLFGWKMWRAEYRVTEQTPNVKCDKWVRLQNRLNVRGDWWCVHDTTERCLCWRWPEKVWLSEIKTARHQSLQETLKVYIDQPQH